MSRCAERVGKGVDEGSGGEDRRAAVHGDALARPYPQPAGAEPNGRRSALDQGRGREAQRLAWQQRDGLLVESLSPETETAEMRRDVLGPGRGAEAEDEREAAEVEQGRRDGLARQRPQAMIDGP